MRAEIPVPLQGDALGIRSQDSSPALNGRKRTARRLSLAMRSQTRSPPSYGGAGGSRGAVQTLNLPLPIRRAKSVKFEIEPQIHTRLRDEASQSQHRETSASHRTSR